MGVHFGPPFIRLLTLRSERSERLEGVGNRTGGSKALNTLARLFPTLRDGRPCAALRGDLLRVRSNLNRPK